MKQPCALTDSNKQRLLFYSTKKGIRFVYVRVFVISCHFSVNKVNLSRYSINWRINRHNVHLPARYTAHSIYSAGVSVVELVEKIRQSLIGEGTRIPTSFGEKPLIYADYTASGRSLTFI